MKSRAVLLTTLLLGAGGLLPAFLFHSGGMPAPAVTAPRFAHGLQPRKPVDTNGAHGFRRLPVWKDPASLEDIRQSYVDLAQVNLALVDEEISRGFGSQASRLQALFSKAAIYMYDGDPAQAYELLHEARSLAESSPSMRDEWLYTVIFFQGVAGLRLGENENCLDCRGAGACIFPLAPTAVHTNPTGSRAAVKHFTEYLQQFPDDLEVRWLLNLAHMTLGEHPHRVPPQYLLEFDEFGAEDDIGRFHDISHLVGVNRLNLSGGGVMDDFDNDGLLDLAVTSFTQSSAFFRNKGDGTFEDRSDVSGLGKQYCGFILVQTDYDNDGYLDLYISRAGGFHLPKRPSLLHNNGDGTFTDVTREAGLMKPGNSPCGTWADFDNDGYLDFYLGTGDPYYYMLVPNRMFKNQNGQRFADITTTSGTGHLQKGHGTACGDWDRDGNIDLFVEMGGAAPGDPYHNLLFQNPGQGNNWLTLKLVGKETNRAAIGARIKVVTAGAKPLTVHRHVSSGSSFGGNPLQQTIGLGKASSVATVEVFWPTSRTTQVFHDVAVNQAFEITELAKEYRQLNWTRVPVPQE